MHAILGSFGMHIRDLQLSLSGADIGVALCVTALFRDLVAAVNK